MSSHGNRLHLPAAQKYYCYTGMNRGRIPRHNSQVSSLCILTMWMQLYDSELYTETNKYRKDFCCAFRIMHLHWTKTRPKFSMDSIKAYGSISVCGTQWSLDSLLQFPCLALGLWLSLVNIPFLASPALWGLHYSLRFTFTASYISVQILSTVCALRPSFKILVESSMTALLLHPVSLQKQYHMDNAYFICPDPDPLGHSSVGISF